MVKINKQPAPQGLTELYEKCKNENLSPDESYRKLTNPLKKDVINRLMAEQGHICAYCMRKIPDERELPADTPAVTIEHLIPRNPIDFIIFLDMYNSETDPRTPYCGIIIWWLQEQLKNPR